MSRGRYRIAILGGGPVGLIAALAAARRSPTLLLLGSRPAPSPVPRIETMPASMLNFLIDFGVHPQRLGVFVLHEEQQVAWARAQPEMLRGHAMAYIDKERLQLELLERAAAAPRLDIRIESRLPQRCAAGWGGPGWSSKLLLDATGRDAALSRERVALPKPWVARPFWCQTRQPQQERRLRIAALPFGYAYRVASASTDTLWVAGRGRALGMPAQILQRSLQQSGAAWLMEGFPPLADAQTGRAFPVSLQWTCTCAAIPIGDAALARDVLSSQGLAAGFSAACYGIASDGEHDTLLLRRHQDAQRHAHVRSLAQLLATCRFRGREEWGRYRAFLSAHTETAPHSDAVFLAGGRLAEAGDAKFG